MCTHVCGQVDRASHRSPLRVGRRKNHLPDSRLNQGAGAHGTGFQGHQQRAVIEAPVTAQAAGLTNGHQLSMAKRIVVQLSLIDAMANAAAVVIQNNGANGNLSSFTETARALNQTLHPGLHLRGRQFDRGLHRQALG